MFSTKFHTATYMKGYCCKLMLILTLHIYVAYLLKVSNFQPKSRYIYLGYHFITLIYIT